MMELALLGAATAFAIAFLAGFLARRLAVQLGFVAVPRDDRHHRQPMPLLGGSAILAGILLPGALALALAAVWGATALPGWLPERLRLTLQIHLPGILQRTPQALLILAGAVLLHVVGVIDDRRRLGPWLKLAAQSAVAVAVVVLCPLRLLQFAGEPLSGIATVLWIVLITNAINFIDNVDGLAAGVTAICSAALLAAAVAAGQLFVSAWLCLLLGASAGFLLHNFPPARLFMGDAGSLVLGYMLAVLTILTTYYRPGSDGPGLYYSVFSPVVLLAVPLYDTFSVIVLRIRARQSPMVGDTRHFSHRLLRRGMGPRKTVLTIYLATAATAAGASLLPHVTPTGAWIVFGQTAGIVLLIALLESAEGRGRLP